MTDEQVLYVSQAVLASAFYYGLAGGLIGAAIVPACRFVIRRVRSLFQWR